jgi:hydroxyacylglutathione hydrolase
LKARRFVVGVVRENCYLVRSDSSDGALIVDPGAEPETLLDAIERDGARLDAILVTHCHFDHVGAVAPLARATGAEVWAPASETAVLSDIRSYVPFPGFALESWDAEHALAGGETIELAGFTIDVLSTPGHTPGHLTFSFPAEQAIFSGDLLFKGSVGRADMPGGNASQLADSIHTVIDLLPPETTVYPGHTEVTSIAAELAGNPNLQKLAS